MASVAVLVALLLVVGFGGIALRGVTDRWDARRTAYEQHPALADPEPGPGPTDDVVLVGDSITEQAEPVFHEVLDAKYHVRIRGRGGYRVEEMEPYAIELATTKPEQVVINLGTNDVLQGFPIDKSAQAFSRMIDEFGSARCLHVVTVNQNLLNENDPGLPSRALVFNLDMRRLIAGHRVNVIDWSAAVSAYNDAGAPDGPITSDTVHPTEAGRKLLAKLYKEALDGCT